MKNSIFLPFLLLGFILSPTNINAVCSPALVNKMENSFAELNAEDIINYDRKQIETKLCRKLKLKERIALKVLKRKLKKKIGKTVTQVSPTNDKTEGEDKAMKGVVMGLVGLIIPGAGIFGLILSIEALIAIKRHPENEKGIGLAIGGIILGIMGVIIFFYVAWLLIRFA